MIEACWKDKGSYIVINGVELTNVNYKGFALTSEPNYSFYISAVNRNNEATLKPQLTIYGWKMYQDDVLVREFVPCYRKSDNEIGLFDIVNGVFYTNDGDGTFLKGNNV